MKERHYETIVVNQTDGAVEIVMNQPETLNALSLTMKRELADAIDEAIRASDIKILVLSGAGRAFCSGANLKDMSSSTGLAYRNELRKLQDNLIARLWDSETIVVAGVQGYAAGAGFSLALAADLVVAEEGATFYAPFVIGPAVVPDTGIAFLLPKVVGVSTAKKILLTGEKVSAHEAYRLGIVQTLVPTGGLRQGLDETIAALRRAAPMALGLTKTLVHAGLNSGLDDVLELEATLQALMRLSKDHAEGVRAFAEDRPPRFVGS